MRFAMRTSLNSPALQQLHRIRIPPHHGALLNAEIAQQRRTSRAGIGGVRLALDLISSEILASGLIEGNVHQLLNQLVGVSIAWGLGIVGTLAILFFVDKLIGLRVSQEQENQGLDLSQHGEEGYNWEAS